MRRPGAVARGAAPLAFGLILLLVTTGAYSSDDILLSVTSGPALGDVTLTWSGGVSPYLVVRSTTASMISDPGSLLGETAATVWIDTPPTQRVFFYGVVMCTSGVDCAGGSCADGWCCDTACAGTCEACNLTGSAGTCTFLPAGRDPAAECPGAQTCNGAGACNLRATGDSCTAPSQCQSGFCADGYCCNVDCTVPCKACGLPSARGTCTNIPIGVFPMHGTCNTCGVCNGTGTCCNTAECNGPCFP